MENALIFLASALADTKALNTLRYFYNRAIGVKQILLTTLHMMSA